MSKESLAPSSPHEEDQSREEREEGERLMDEKNKELEKLGLKNEREGLLWLHSREAAHHEEAAAHAAEAEQRATEDALTGLLNRRGLEAAAEKILSPRPVPETEHRKGVADRPSSFSVLVVDIDDFKGINDRYGHPAGDAVLRAVAELLAGSLRKEDIAARLGGDEFILIFPTDAGEKIKERLEGKEINAAIEEKDGTKTTIPVTLSGGLKEIKPGENFKTAYATADAALYGAKRNGRNGITTASETGE